MNGFILVYLWPSWIWLTILDLVIGLLTLISLWTVQCSDPGIQPRTEEEEDIKKVEGFDPNDSFVSLNPYEKAIFLP